MTDAPPQLRALLTNIRREIEQAFVAAEGLLLYRGMFAEPPGQAYLALLRDLGGTRDAHLIRRRAAELFSTLAAAAEQGLPGPGDAWQRYLVQRLLVDDNPFTRSAQRLPLEAIPPGLRRAARQDLQTLGRIYRVNGARLMGAVTEAVGEAGWPDLTDLGPEVGAEPLGARLAAAEAAAWGDLLPDLAARYREQGVGPFATYRAFRWVRQSGEGRLMPIARPDPITFDDLFGYEEQRHLVRRNTERFLARYPASNLLLYGERGTGKSSTVKALLNAYGGKGLRLVEVSKSALGDFHQIIEVLADRPERFVIFVDDLAFDENEVGYTELKAILEGGIEVRPENVVIYATSNRRHLVLERFSDRAAPDGEVHPQDTLQEKLSLADRFGVTVIFLSPDQEQYLAIVEGLARRRQLPIDGAILRRRALQWAAWNNGRSGRTARQFVDDLTAELGMRAGS